MPDVWTNNPEKLRDMLQKNEADISCGAPGKILQGRDPAWTCHLAWREPNGQWIGEIYVHPAEDLVWTFSSPFLGDLSAVLMVGLIVGFFGGKYGSRRALQ